MDYTPVNTSMSMQQPPQARYPLQDLTVGQTIGRVFSIVTTQWLTFFQLALSVVIPFFFVLSGGTFTFWSILATGLTKMETDQSSDNWQDYQAVVVESIVALGLIVVGSVILSVVVTIVGQAAMIRATAELYAHNRMPDASVALQKGLWQFCELFLAGMLLQMIVMFVVALPIIAMVHEMALLGVILGFFTPFVAFYLSIRLALVYPAIVIEERCTASGGLKRSWQLTQGAFCDIWCSKTVFALLILLILYLAMKLFLVSANHANEKGAIAITVLILSLPNFFFTPCSCVLQTVLYMNRRVRTDGLTQQGLIQELVDHRAVANGTADINMTAPLLTATEVAHAQVDPNAVLLEEGGVTVNGMEAPPKVETMISSVEAGQV